MGLSMSVSASSSNSALLNIAFNAIARATSSSQVLSLDLTSVIIMLVLKIVIAFVQWVNGATSARFLSKNMRGVDQAGGLCVLEYAFGEEEMVDCFGRTFCESQIAPEFLMNLVSYVTPLQKKHQKMFNLMQKGFQDRLREIICD